MDRGAQRADRRNHQHDGQHVDRHQRSPGPPVPVAEPAPDLDRSQHEDAEHEPGPHGPRHEPLLDPPRHPRPAEHDGEQHPAPEHPPERLERDDERGDRPPHRRRPQRLGRRRRPADELGGEPGHAVTHRPTARRGAGWLDPRGGSQLGRVLRGRAEALGEVDDRVVRAAVGGERRTTERDLAGRHRPSRILEGLREVGLEAVGEVLDLLGGEAGEVRADFGGVGPDVVQEDCGGHRATPSGSSSAVRVVENSCQSVRWVASIARPCGLMP